MGNAREHKRTREAIGIRWIWRRTAEMVSIKSTQEQPEPRGRRHEVVGSREERFRFVHRGKLGFKGLRLLAGSHDSVDGGAFVSQGAHFSSVWSWICCGHGSGDDVLHRGAVCAYLQAFLRRLGGGQRRRNEGFRCGVSCEWRCRGRLASCQQQGALGRPPAQFRSAGSRFR